MGLISSTFQKKPPRNLEDEHGKQHRLKDERIVKLLLYGPGEVGKTTILRRMMLIHGNNLENDRKRYRPNICYNVIEGAYLIISHSARLFKYDLMTLGSKKKFKGVVYTVSENDVFHAKRIWQAAKYWSNKRITLCHLNPSQNGRELLKPDEEPNGPAVVESILYFYKSSPWFKMCLGFRNKFSLYENWLFFADKLDEYPSWGGSHWVPSNNDLLMSRMRTTGMNKFLFKYEKTQYQLIDVGGQRQERNIFFSLFDQVDAVIFVTSLSDYDEACFEDINTPRLKEGLNAWKKAVNSDAFKNLWVILMFNKKDLFQIKYYDRKIPIKAKLTVKPEVGKPPTWQTEDNRECEKAIEWFENLYMAEVPQEKRLEVRTYVTTALGEKGDENISNVMELCVDFLVNKLIEYGTGFK